MVNNSQVTPPALANASYEGFGEANIQAILSVLIGARKTEQSPHAAVKNTAALQSPEVKSRK